MRTASLPQKERVDGFLFVANQLALNFRNTRCSFHSMPSECGIRGNSVFALAAGECPPLRD